MQVSFGVNEFSILVHLIETPIDYLVCASLDNDGIIRSCNPELHFFILSQQMDLLRSLTIAVSDERVCISLLQSQVVWDHL